MSIMRLVALVAELAYGGQVEGRVRKDVEVQVLPRASAPRLTARERLRTVVLAVFFFGRAYW